MISSKKMEKQRMNGTIERTDKEKSKCRKTLTHTAEINPFFTGVLRRYHIYGSFAFQAGVGVSVNPAPAYGGSVSDTQINQITGEDIKDLFKYVISGAK
jgi:hypothetical protein